MNGHANINGQNQKNAEGKISANFSSETQEDSGAGKKSKKSLDEKKISDIIQHIRSYGQKYLGSKDGRNYDRVPLSTICKKLRTDADFVKRRDQKLFSKEGEDL